MNFFKRLCNTNKKIIKRIDKFNMEKERIKDK